MTVYQTVNGVYEEWQYTKQ